MDQPAAQHDDPLMRMLASAPVVPLIDTGAADSARALARALAEGGLGVLEVVLRKPGALEGMAAIARERDAIEEKAGQRIVVGAGTVLDLDQAKRAHEAGAQFIVSPGLLGEIVDYCLDNDLPVFPGTATPGEVQRAFAMGLRAVKFFPAELVGGVPMLKALSSVFSDMRFMPTGGVSAANLADYCALQSVIACGGS